MMNLKNINLKNMNLKNCNIKLLAIVLIFLLGLFYYTNSYNLYEPLTNDISNNVSKRCPNMLVEKDGEIYLYNSKLASVPGVNPIKFDSLDEYAEFVEWQKSQDIDCPILYLQYTTDTQNNDLIQVKPSIFENSGGLPSQKTKNIPGLEDEQYYEKNKMLDATKDSTPDKDKNFNTNMYQGFDKNNQNIGLDTPLDKIFTDKNNTSANPMDTNWGGKNYTKSRIEAGDYKGREVYKHTN